VLRKTEVIFATKLDSFVAVKSLAARVRQITAHELNSTELQFTNWSPPSSGLTPFLFFKIFSHFRFFWFGEE